MFKRISRIGSTPCKFQYALVLKELSLSLPLDGMEIQCIWTRGPHRSKSITAESKGNGVYTWSFDDQKRTPMMLNCTLYRKEKPDAKAATLFQSKPCKLTLKHVTDNGAKTRTIGEVSVDLADYAEENKPPISKDFDKMKVEGTKNIDAFISFTLHSRPLSGAKEAQMETMSQIEGMDKSQIDMDSTADFGDFGTAAKKNRGLDSDSDDNSDLDNPDDIAGFGAAATKKNITSLSDSDSDGSDNDNMGGFGTAKSTSKATSPIPSKGKDDNLSKLKDKYKDDDHSPEVSRNTRPSANRDLFAYKSSVRDKEQQERMKHLEKQALISDSKREELEERVLKLQNELKLQKDHNASLQQELELHDRNTKEIVDSIVVEWSAKVGELQVETKSLRNRLTILETEHSQQLKENAKSIHDEYDNKINVYQQEIVQLKRELDQLRGRRIAFDEVNDQIRANYSKHKLPDEIKALQMQVKYFERQIVEADLTIDCVRNTYQSTNTVLMGEVKSLEEIKQQLRTALSEAQHMNKELNAKNIVLDTQCKKQSESKMKMSEILNQMEVMISEKDERLGILQNEYDDLKLANIKLQKNLHRYQSNNE